MTRWLLAPPLAIGLLAWVTTWLQRAFDYDEVMQAHAVWQIGEGLVPFRDFFECHTPFLWYLFVPALPLLPEGPELLLGLRALGALGFALWVAAMLGCAKRERPELPTPWLVAAGCLTVFTPTTLDLASQFRPDTWAWAASFAALARYAARAPGWRRTAELGLVGSVCALAMPKLALLFPAYCAIDLARRAKQGRRLAPELAGYAGGIALGVGLALAFLFAVGIDPATAWQLSVSYHAHLVPVSGFGRGVWASVVEERLAVAVALAGLVAWAAWLRHRRLSPTTLEAAALVTLLAQLVLVPFPYVQYVVPVFVLAAVFLPYLGLWAEALAPRLRLAPLAATACAAALATTTASLALAAHWQSGQATRFAEVQRTVLALAPPDARILVPPPFHPIVRHDALYGLIQTWLPSGVTTEQTLRRHALPHHERRNPTAYLDELERHAPAVILFTGGREFFYSPEQSAAIDAYLSRHSDAYRRVLDVQPTLWVRADLLAAARARVP